jgi:hypothetical protein
LAVEINNGDNCSNQKNMTTRTKQFECDSKIKNVCIAFITLILTSCVSYKDITKTLPSINQGKTRVFIVPGNVLKIIMKNGEEIKNMKAQKVDAEKISGIQWVEIKSEPIEEGSQLAQVNKTIEIAEIQSLKKRKFSPVKTLGTVVGGITLVAVIAVGSNPPPGRIQLPPNLFKP